EIVLLTPEQFERGVESDREITVQVCPRAHTRRAVPPVDAQLRSGCTPCRVPRVIGEERLHIPRPLPRERPGGIAERVEEDRRGWGRRRGSRDRFGSSASFAKSWRSGNEHGSPKKLSTISYQRSARGKAES